jgi:peptide/nickel transport system permease protein
VFRGRAAAIVSSASSTEIRDKRTIGPGFWIAIGWIVLMVGAAFLAPILPIADPDQTGVGGRLDAPSWDTWFGTDTNGRDMFSRTIWGSRVSLTVGFFAILFGFVIGGPIGIASGFFKGAIDKFLSIIVFILFAFPGLVLALLIISLLGQTLTVVCLTVGIVGVAPIARLARAVTISTAEREFVSAAKILGSTNRRIMVREILPNVVIPMGALAFLGMALAIVGEGGLAFLGLSVEEGFSWGKMIVLGSAPRTLQKAPWVAMFPIGVMFLTVMSLNYAGDRLRDFFDVRELGIGGS